MDYSAEDILPYLTYEYIYDNPSSENKKAIGIKINEIDNAVEGIIQLPKEIDKLPVTSIDKDVTCENIYGLWLTDSYFEDMDYLNATYYIPCGTDTMKLFGKNVTVASNQLHSHPYVETVIPPDCGNYGYTQCDCSGCGYTYYKDITDPIVYSFDVTGYESEHGYTDYQDDVWYLHSGLVNGFVLQFDKNTQLELEYDFLYIWDEHGDLYNRYTGTELAGKSIYINGTTVKLELVTERSVTHWGFKLDAVYGITHDWDVGTITVKPGIEDGEKIYTCWTCGKKMREVLPATLIDQGVIYNNWSGTFNWTLSKEYVLSFSGEGVMTDMDYDYYGDDFTKYYSLIKEVDFGDGITETRNIGMRQMTSLETVKLANSVETIGGNTFRGCSQIKNYILSPNIKSIGYETFYNSSIKEIDIRNAINIDSRAFSSCKLEKIILSDNLEKISEYTFYGSKIKELTIPKNLKEIDNNAFYDCIIDKVNYLNIEQLLTIKYGNYKSNPMNCGTELYINNELIKTLKIPGKLNYISSYCLAGCTSIETVLLPESIKIIPAGAFSGCINLKEVSLPGELITIDDGAFSGATNICNLVIPETCNMIGSNALAKVYSVTFLGDKPSFNDNAFGADTSNITAEPITIAR